MKQAVSIATVICGTVIFIAPLVSHAVGDGVVGLAMSHLGRDVTLRNSAPGWYDGASFAVGLAMVIVGIFAALRREA